MILKIEKIEKQYQDNIILEETNFLANSCEITTVYGESGVGKTTFLNCISGFDFSDCGTCIYNNSKYNMNSLDEMKRFRDTNIAFIFQEYHLFEELTTLQNVLSITNINRSNRKDDLGKALNILEKVGLQDVQNQTVRTLSGGQKQRCGIARALMSDATIIIADEPTGNLDSNTAKDIISLLKKVAENKILIIVTHDMEIVRISDRVYEMKAKKLTLKKQKELDRTTAINKNFDSKKTLKHKPILGLCKIKIEQIKTKKIKYILLFLLFITLSLSSIISLNLDKNSTTWFNSILNTSIQLRTIEFVPEKYTTFFQYQDIVDIRENVLVEEVLPDYTTYHVGTNNSETVLETNDQKVSSNTHNIKMYKIKGNNNYLSQEENNMEIGVLPGVSDNYSIAINKELVSALHEDLNSIIGKEVTLYLNIPRYIDRNNGNSIVTERVATRFIVTGVFKNSPAQEIEYGGFGDANIAIPLSTLNGLIENTAIKSDDKETESVLKSRRIDVTSKHIDNVEKIEEEYKSKDILMKSNMSIIDSLSKSMNIAKNIFKITSIISIILLATVISVVSYYEYLKNTINIAVLKAFGAQRKQIYMMSVFDLLIFSTLASVTSILLLPFFSYILNELDISRYVTGLVGNTFVFYPSTVYFVTLIVFVLTLEILTIFAIINSNVSITKMLRNRE